MMTLDKTDNYFNLIQNDLALNEPVVIEHLGKNYKSQRDEIFNGKYIDGGLVKMLDEDYQAIYNFEFGFETNNSNLLFRSFNKKSGLSFLKFINTLFSQNSEDFVKLDGFVVKDIRKKVKEVQKIQIIDTLVDYTLTKILSSYFPNLKYLDFSNCKILSNASFANLKIENINIKNSIIENTLTLKDLESSLSLYHTDILKIYPVNINSDSIIFSGYQLNQINFKELFLKCFFPKLMRLSIDSFKKYDNSIYYEKSFLFLPYSAPNIEKLSIEGKVYSLDFLEKFKKIMYFNLDSEYTGTEIELWCPYIINKKEKDKIAKIYHSQIEEYKKIFPYIPEKYITTIIEKNNILGHVNTLRLLDATEKEKDILLSNKDLIKYNLSLPNSFKVTEFFRAFYDQLEYYKLEKANGIIINSNNENYEIRENILFNNYDYGLNIIKAKKFIYHISGLPIFIEKQYKPKKIDEIPNYEKKDLSYEKIKISEFYYGISNFDDEDLSVLEFVENFLMNSLYLPSANELSSIDKILASYFYKYEREKTAIKDIVKKHNYYLELINNLLCDIYNDLTFEEKAYIIVNVEINNFLFNQKYKKEDYVCYIIDEAKTLKLLNKRTNNLFSKYLNILKETNKQYYGDYHNYDKTAIIPKQLIKKVKQKTT